MSQFFASGGQIIGSFSFSICPSNEYSRLISFRMAWLDLLAVQGTLKVFSNITVQKHQFFSTQLSLEKAMAPHSSTLAWKIPRLEEPGGLQSMGSQRVGHDSVTSLHLSFSISPSNEHSVVISFKMDWLDLLAVQGTLKVFSNTTVQNH